MLDALASRLRCWVLLYMLQPELMPGSSSARGDTGTLPPEVAALLLQRLRKDMAAAATCEPIAAPPQQPATAADGVHMATPFALSLASLQLVQALEAAGQGGDSAQLRVRPPVAPHADLCASALSLARLVALRLPHAEAAPCQRVAAHAAAPAHAAEVVRLLQLLGGVLRPLLAWLARRLGAQQAEASHAMLTMQEEAHAGPAGAAPAALPEVVAEFTALARLEQVADAVQEVQERL